MRFGSKRAAPEQPSLLGAHDRIEHAPQTHASPSAQRWTTRAQVDMLLAHPRIRELWPTGEYVAADPCAGTGQLMRHVDEAALNRPLMWKAWELDLELATSPDRYRPWDRSWPWWFRRVRWACTDAARLAHQPAVDLVITNLPWFNVFERFVGHWRSVAFPGALIIALCDDQERTRESARRWLAEGNMPAIIGWLPGRQSFDGADDGAYPWSCSWCVWRPGERRTTSEVILL